MFNVEPNLNNKTMYIKYILMFIVNLFMFSK